MMSFGSRLNYYRKLNEMTLEALAEAVGVSLQAVSNWEHDLSLPETSRLTTIASTLKTTVGKLLDDDILPSWTPKVKLFDENHMYTFIKSAAVSAGLNQTLSALTYIKKPYEGRFSSVGNVRVPQINMVLTEACHALALGLCKDGLIAAILLHEIPVPKAEDVVLDDKTVGVLSLISAENTAEQKRKAEYTARLTKNPTACLIKCIDRAAVLSAMSAGMTREKMAETVVDTEKNIMPLIRVIKDSSPEFNNAAFLLGYQIKALLEAYKNLL